MNVLGQVFMGGGGGVEWSLVGWFALMLLAIGATALFSGMEIGMFSLSRVRLRLRAHQGEPAALALTRWLKKPTYPLEGLLILQNLMGFIVSAALTAILETRGFSPITQTILSTLIVTPIILVACDILPKDLFHRYADHWMYRLVGILRWSLRLVTVIPILPLIHFMGWISTLPMRRWSNQNARAIVGPRAEILSLFEESTQTGLVSGTQQDLVQRALRMARITIREVMLPWNRVVGVPVGISHDGFIALVRHYNVSRMPVLGRSTTEVLGFMAVVEVLGDPAGFDIRRHIHPPMTLIGEQTVRSAITLMQRARETIAVVVDRQGRAIGLVTMKDLIEELVGDLENW